DVTQWAYGQLGVVSGDVASGVMTVSTPLRRSYFIVNLGHEIPGRGVTRNETGSSDGFTEATSAGWSANSSAKIAYACCLSSIRKDSTSGSASSADRTSAIVPSDAVTCRKTSASPCLVSA